MSSILLQPENLPACCIAINYERLSVRHTSDRTQEATWTRSRQLSAGAQNGAALAIDRGRTAPAVGRLDANPIRATAPAGIAMRIGLSPKRDGHHPIRGAANERLGGRRQHGGIGLIRTGRTRHHHGAGQDNYSLHQITPSRRFTAGQPKISQLTTGLPLVGHKANIKPLPLNRGRPDFSSTRPVPAPCDRRPAGNRS